MYEWVITRINGLSSSGLVPVGLLLVLLMVLAVSIIYSRRRRYRADESRNTTKEIKITRDVEKEDVKKNPAGVKDTQTFTEARLAVQTTAEELPQTSCEEEARLTLCDSVVIGDQRRLVLVRRDNVEHLILLGNAGDMVIEHNIPVEVNSETETPDPTSILAIAQVKNTENTDTGEADFTQDRISLERADKEENVQADAEKNRANEMLWGGSADEQMSRQENASADLDAEPGIAALPDANPNDFSDGLEPETSSLETILSPGSAISSIFPVRLSESALDFNREETRLESTIFSMSSVSGKQAMTESDHEASVERLQKLAEHQLSEPPVASYFAGQPKRMQEQQAQQPDSIQRQPHSADPVMPVASPASDLHALPLNPFVSSQEPPGIQPSSPPHIPSLQPFTAQTPSANPASSGLISQAVTPPSPVSPVMAPETAHAKEQVAVAEARSTPPLATSDPEQPMTPVTLPFVGSFLGFPLQPTGNSGAGGMTSSLSSSSRAHLQPTSQPSAINLKKSVP